MRTSTLKTIIKLVQALFTAGLLLNLSNSLPTGLERWKSPCGTSTSTDNLDFPERPLSEVISEMMISVLESQEYASRMKSIIATSRIMSDMTLTYLENEPIHGYDLIKGITEKDLEVALKNISKVHLDYYRTISIHLVFIEQMRFDEEIYMNSEHIEDIVNLESKLFDVLCYMTEVISNNNATIDHVSRDVMNMEIRSLSEKYDRFARDYITAKENLRLMDNFGIVYTEIKDYVSQTV